MMPGLSSNRLEENRRPERIGAAIHFACAGLRQAMG
jgi:hypothetical protein